MTDWSGILGDLRDRGWTQVRLSKRIGASQSALSDLKRGKTTQPVYDVGRSLIELHRSGKRFRPKDAHPTPEGKAA